MLYCRIFDNDSKLETLFDAQAKQDEVISQTMQTSLAPFAGIPLSNSQPSGEIFIRECYLAMAKFIIADLTSQDRQDNRIVVTGTPQIGKSTFLSFLCSYLPIKLGIKHIYVLSQLRSKNVDEGKNPPPEYSASYITYNLKDRKEADEPYAILTEFLKYKHPEDLASFSREARGENSIAFLDGFATTPSKVRDFEKVVLFSSQGITEGETSNLENLEKTYYMPPWSEAEMQQYRDKSPFAESIQTRSLYRWFGGAIGYCVKRDIERWKVSILHDAVHRHVDRFLTLGLDVAREPSSPIAVAALVQIVPTDSFRDVQKKDWLSITVERAVNYRVEVKNAATRKAIAASSTGSTAGIWFEEFFSKMYLLLEDRNLAKFWLYPGYGKRHTKPEWTKDMCQLKLKLCGEPRIVKWGYPYFPVALDTLHRFSVNADSVDFYYITKGPEGGIHGRKNAETGATSTSSPFTIVLIQTTVAARHSAKWTAINDWLHKMDKYVENAEANRTAIATA